MTNTTPTYWDVDGVSLQTYAKNIESLGPRLTPPPLRGENELIPFALGRRWVPKVVDSRVIPLAMWVRGYNDDGSRPSDQPRKFYENWEALVNLLWTPGKQINLTKRFYHAGILRTATAKAEFVGGFEPKMIGRSGAKFVVDLELADPYFYDAETQTFNLTNGDQNITVFGNAKTYRIFATINGSRTNAKIISRTVEPDVQFEYYREVPTGDYASIDVQNFSVAHTTAVGPDFEGSGFIRHTGDAYWLALQPGVNVVNLSSTAGTGTVQLQVKGAWR